MSIETAKQTLKTALDGVVVREIDEAKAALPVGNLLVFEGFKIEDTALTVYLFGLYVSQKVLDSKTGAIYRTLDDVGAKLQEAHINGNPIGGRQPVTLKELLPSGFANGVIEYRFGIEITEG